MPILTKNPAEHMCEILTDAALSERLVKMADDIRRFDPITRSAMLREAAKRIGQGE